VYFERSNFETEMAEEKKQRQARIRPWVLIAVALVLLVLIIEAQPPKKPSQDSNFQLFR